MTETVTIKETKTVHISGTVTMTDGDYSLKVDMKLDRFDHVH